MTDNVVPLRKEAVLQARFAEIGSSGLKHWGGYLEEEFLRELRGKNGIRIFNEMSKNDAVIGASLFAYTTLAKEVTFNVAPAADGGQKAQEIADFIRGALFDDMAHSWRDLLGEIFSFLTFGWSWFEVVFKRRMGETNDPTTKSRYNDGRIGWRKWSLRKQESLEAWVLDSNGGVKGMIQRAAPLFVPIEIPIEKSLLFRTAVQGNNPEGQSILRTAYQSFYYKRRLQIVRGIGVERDLAGMPVLTPPQGLDLWNANDSNAATLKAAAERLVRGIRRDEHEGVVKPHGWELELLGSSGSRQFDITGIIGQLNAEIAMSMMTDFLLVGHEKVGARSLATDKRAVFSHAAASFLDAICTVINRFAIPELVRINGWPTELAPTLTHGPVAEIELSDLVNFIEKMANAGLLMPDEELEKHLRQRALLPPPPEGVKRPLPKTEDEPEEPEEENEEDVEEVDED